MAGKEDLKLLGMLLSPFALRVRLALSIKGLTYEYVEEDLDNKSDLLLTSNPVHKKVPVLIHNGKPICESLAIVQYVDEAFPGPSILPADHYERATARSWAAYVDDKLFPSWLGIMGAVTEGEKAEKVKEMFAVIEHLEKAFAKCSKGKDFFGGESIGYLDLALGLLLFWFEATRRMLDLEIINSSKTPLLAMWAVRFEENAMVKKAVPDMVKVVEYGNKCRAAAAAAAAGAE